MKIKNIIGLSTVLSAVLMIVLIIIMTSQDILVDAILIKTSIFNIVLLFAFSGLYITNQHCTPKPIVKKTITLISLLLIAYGGLVAFDLLPIHLNWNILVSLGILYITIIQMQLLKWEKSKNLLKFIGFLTLLANIFIITYYLFKLKYQFIGLILDIAVITSIFTFLIGLILSPKKNKTIQ